LTFALDVPMFWNVTVQSGVPVQTAPVYTTWLRFVDTTWTRAELVNDPNRPKTNPAIAIAAMSVMAMRMTVASTGEMAFLFFL